MNICTHKLRFDWHKFKYQIPQALTVAQGAALIEQYLFNLSKQRNDYSF